MARTSTCAEASSGLRTGSTATRRRADPAGNQQAGNAAAYREHQSFQKKLPDQAETARAQRPRGWQSRVPAAASAPTGAAPYSRMQSRAIRPTPPNSSHSSERWVPHDGVAQRKDLESDIAGFTIAVAIGRGVFAR